MGIYRDLELDFIDRTMRLIEQYQEGLDKYPFEEQFNYTLVINCLLGLVVLPKERVGTYVIDYRLNAKIKQEMGIIESQFGPDIDTLRTLVREMRHAIAHFDLEVISEDPEKNLIDWLEFRNTQRDGCLVARFKATELLPFLRYYANSLIENLRKHR